MLHERAIIPDLIPVPSLSGVEFSENRHNQSKTKRYLCPAQLLYSSRRNSCFSQNIYDSKSWQIFRSHYSDLKMTDQLQCLYITFSIESFKFPFRTQSHQIFPLDFRQKCKKLCFEEKAHSGHYSWPGNAETSSWTISKRKVGYNARSLCFQAKSSLRRLFLAWHGDTKTSF